MPPLSEVLAFFFLRYDCPKARAVTNACSKSGHPVSFRSLQSPSASLTGKQPSFGAEGLGAGLQWVACLFACLLFAGYGRMLHIKRRGRGKNRLALERKILTRGEGLGGAGRCSKTGDEGDAACRLVKARRNVPSVLCLLGAHQWWDGKDAAVHPHLRFVPASELVAILRPLSLRPYASPAAPPV